MKRRREKPHSLSGNLWLKAVVFCLVVAACIRLPFFSQIPAGLNRDEAALGYNAYSLLKTGRDEYGKFLPISITSFGDEKLPGYVYLSIPSIALFGLNPFSVRLPSLIAGFAVIIGMGILALQLAGDLKLSSQQKILLSFFTMLFIAISPWADHFSRVAYEAHVALAFFIFAFVSYKAAMETVKPNRQRLFFLVAGFCWAVTLLTYHSYHILTPLFVLALFILDFSKIKRADKKGIYGAAAIGLVAVLLLLKGGILQANAVKSSGISPFHKEDLLAQVTEYRNFLPGDNSLYERVIINTVTEGIVRFTQNYISTFSAEFYFIHGSGHGDHNPDHMNNFHPFLAPLILIGALTIWEQRKNVKNIRIVLWFLLGLIPAALTIQPQHEIRLSPVFPLLELFAALGVVTIWMSVTRKRLRIILAIILGIIIFFAANRLFLQYTFIIPTKTESNLRYHILARVLAKYRQKALPVITQSPTSSPYIWYLFENTYDPASLKGDLERYPVDDFGFIHVKRVANVYFETIKWDDIYEWARKENLILVFQPKEIPVEVQKSGRMSMLEEVHNEKGQVIYQVWQVNMNAGTEKRE